MSHNDQNQQLQVWNSAVAADQSNDTAAGPYPVPPRAIITHEEEDYPHQKVPPSGETKFKGHGFWRGCFAGMCCYCCLDLCF